MSPSLSCLLKIILPTLPLILASCDLHLEQGNGEITEKSIPVPSFRQVVIGGNYEVHLRESDEQGVRIRTDENLLDFINVEVNNDRLYINSIRTLKGTEGIAIDVLHTGLEHVAVDGASAVSSEGIIRSEQLTVALSGAGSLQLNVNVDLLNLELSGAGAAELNGYARQQNTDISGAGGLAANNLETERCEISLSGIGGAEIFVTDYLKATISGIGGIKYHGRPREIVRKISGIGSISAADEPPQAP
jgi:hypothetical protein